MGDASWVPCGLMFHGTSHYLCLFDWSVCVFLIMFQWTEKFRTDSWTWHIMFTSTCGISVLIHHINGCVCVWHILDGKWKWRGYQRSQITTVISFVWILQSEKICECYFFFLFFYIFFYIFFIFKVASCHIWLYTLSAVFHWPWVLLFLGNCFSSSVLHLFFEIQSHRAVQLYFNYHNIQNMSPNVPKEMFWQWFIWKHEYVSSRGICNHMYRLVCNVYSFQAWNLVFILQNQNHEIQFFPPKWARLWLGGIQIGNQTHLLYNVYMLLLKVVPDSVNLWNVLGGKNEPHGTSILHLWLLTLPFIL